MAKGREGGKTSLQGKENGLVEEERKCQIVDGKDGKMPIIRDDNERTIVTGGSLAERLGRERKRRKTGMAPDEKEEQDAMLGAYSPLLPELYQMMALGDLDGQLALFRGLLDRKQISPITPDCNTPHEKLLEMLKQSSSPSYKTIDRLVATIPQYGKTHMNFVEEILTVLLRRHYISDWTHHELVEWLMGGEERLSLLLLYLRNVPDIRESTLVCILHFALSHATFQLKSDQFTPRDALLLTILSPVVEREALKRELCSLSLEQVQELLALLHRMLQYYSHTYAEGFRPLTNGHIELPSRANVLNWIEAILDSHYPALLDSISTLHAKGNDPNDHNNLLNDLDSLLHTLHMQCAIDEALLDLRSPLSTLLFLCSNPSAPSSSIALTFSQSSSLTHNSYPDYILESVCF